MTVKRIRATRHRAPHIPRVAVLVDTSTSWGQRIHAGIHKYDQKHGRWQLFVEARGLEERLRVPAGWQGDGVIARIGSTDMADEIKALGIPVVNVSGIQVPNVSFPQVTTDLKASAELAAKHFFERGYKHFAYFSLIGLPYVAAHQKAFADAVAQSEGECVVRAVKPQCGAEPDWRLDLTKLSDWLKTLPKPLGVLAWNPSSAREVIYACQNAGILVPEEVAVLSGTDDELLCNLLHVPVSGILVPAEDIGYQAAKLLDQLMRGGAVPNKTETLPPIGVVSRKSTDSLAISDASLVKAISFIRLNAVQQIQVSDVARHAGLSRRVMERRFTEVLNRTPAEEIRRLRLERAKQLLSETDLSIPEVADATGFCSPEYLTYVFSKEVGTSPAKFRNKVKHHEHKQLK
ncbi:MAG: substrate-binding domain-containing protein [Verrucomicrobiae bacterium]|nr:substrate-binding domain-containing protein [Verrucomicrobiae bacterium]